MKSFEEFYNQELKPAVDNLEKERKKILSWSIFGFLFLMFGLFVVFSYFADASYSLFFIILGLIIYFSLAGFFLSGFKSRFKSQVIDKIIKFLDPSLEYKPKEYLPFEVFKKSLLFETKESVNRYTGSDLIKGNIGLTSVAFSQVHAEHKETHTYTDSQGRTQTETRWYTIFRGVLFVADFNKNFNTKVVVFPNSEGISWFDKLFSSTLRNLKPIKLEDPEFESLFNVYGEDQVESRYILSTSLMRRLVELWNRFKEAGAKDIRISFIDSYIFIAIDFRKDLLEPSLFSAIDYNRIVDYYWRVKAFYDVVDDLNLNRRIWGKT